MKIYELKVEEDYAFERIDKYISDTLADFSRSYIQKLIESENITVNGKKCKASYKCNLSDSIKVILPDSTIPDILAENISLDVLYEDDDVIVVNKPKGMVVHPAAGHYTGTLVNALMYHCQDNLSGINGVLRPGIVHRIDMNTTGSIIACKNNIAHEALALQFKEHSINREYRAIVHGIIEEDEMVINKPIGRSAADRKKMAVNAPNGKKAITHIKVLKRFNDYTYVSCVLETGRTHQIRVHMASINHPVLGDGTYGNIKSSYKLDGQTLHAYKLGFMHPSSGEYIETIAKLPDYFEHLLEILK